MLPFLSVRVCESAVGVLTLFVIYDGVSGIITDIKTHEHPSFGKFWNVSIKDGEDEYILQMNYSGGYASAFSKTMSLSFYRLLFSLRERISHAL